MEHPADTNIGRTPQNTLGDVFSITLSVPPAMRKAGK